MSSQRYERVRFLPPVSPSQTTPISPFSIDTDSSLAQVSGNDQDDTPVTPATPPHDAQPTPSSPPPSFRSRSSSPSSRRLLASHDPLATDAERTLNDTFNDGSDSENDEAEDDRQRLMRSNTVCSIQEQGNNGDTPDVPRTVNTIPPPATPAALGAALNVPTRRPASFNQSQNDGVFANLDAKPERGEKLEELPPVCHIPTPDFIQNIH